MCWKAIRLGVPLYIILSYLFFLGKIPYFGAFLAAALTSFVSLRLADVTKLETGLSSGFAIGFGGGVIFALFMWVIVIITGNFFGTLVSIVNFSQIIVTLMSTTIFALMSGSVGGTLGVALQKKT